MTEVQQVRYRSIQDRIQIATEERDMENSRDGGSPSQWPKGSKTYLPNGTLACGSEGSLLKLPLAERPASDDCYRF
jgi:hypothetical protein